MLTIVDKIVIGALAVVIVLNVAFQVYIRLPEDDDEGNAVLTVFYGGEKWGYTLPGLRDIDAFSGVGSMMTKIGVKGPYNFTGVRLDLLLEDLDISGDSVWAQVIALDGYTVTFSGDEIQGNVEVFDESGNITDNVVTLLVVYSQDGIPLDSGDGPLRLAYVGQENCVTQSSYWVKQVTEIVFSRNLVISSDFLVEIISVGGGI